MFKCPSVELKCILEDLICKYQCDPKTTFTVFNHPPDFGKFPNKLGAKAKNINGNANPSPKPNIAIDKIVAPPSEFSDVPNTNPNAGPIHENDTIIKVKAMKKIPNKPPEFEALSTLFDNLLGIVISNAPKNEIANVTNIIKKKVFK